MTPQLFAASKIKKQIVVKVKHDSVTFIKNRDNQHLDCPENTNNLRILYALRFKCESKSIISISCLQNCKQSHKPHVYTFTCNTIQEEIFEGLKFHKPVKNKVQTIQII